jgi:hypothetical protein
LLSRLALKGGIQILVQFGNGTKDYVGVLVLSNVVDRAHAVPPLFTAQDYGRDIETLLYARFVMLELRKTL